MRTLPAVIVSCVAAAGVAAEPQTLTGKVVAVADGDTLTLLDADNVQHQVRLHGIDAPERRHPFGTKSGDGLAWHYVRFSDEATAVVDRTKTRATAFINSPTTCADTVEVPRSNLGAHFCFVRDSGCVPSSAGPHRQRSA